MRLTQLPSVGGAIPIVDLTREQVLELQRALCHLGYPIGEIDGDLGLRTRTAWAEFKTDVHLGDPDRIGPGSVATLGRQIAEIGAERLAKDAGKAETMAAIGAECRAQGLGLRTQVAYVLATAQWETAHTFKPVREAFWRDEDWRRQHLRYYPYYGRGYVQLTWRANYERYGDILGVDLAGTPDLALDANIALFVLVHGFKTGGFTGRKIADYVSETATDFVKARRCINGMDRAREIAALAEQHLRELP